MIRILLVEDDKDIMASIVCSLMDLGSYQIQKAASAEEALSFHAEYDVALLDIMLPGRSGIELCAMLRKRSTCPVIFLSCLDDSITIVQALQSGGDDYIVKPFDAPVLHARIQANLRRVRMERRLLQPTEPLTCADFVLHPDEAYVSKETGVISLLPIENRLLTFLMRHEGNYYKAKELYREIWGQDDMGNIKTVLVHMHNLRAKIEENPECPRHILNVRGRGYTFHA